MAARTVGDRREPPRRPLRGFPRREALPSVTAGETPPRPTARTDLARSRRKSEAGEHGTRLGAETAKTGKCCSHARVCGKVGGRCP